jgi:hypothetical protein
VRTGFLVVRDQDFPAQRGGAGGLREGLERGEANDESAPHVGDTGASERLVAGHGVARERPARVRGRAQDPGAGGARRDRSRRDRRATEDGLGRSVGDAAGKRRRGCVSEGRVGQNGSHEQRGEERPAPGKKAAGDSVHGEQESQEAASPLTTEGVFGGEIMPPRRRAKSARPSRPNATDGTPSAASAFTPGGEDRRERQGFDIRSAGRLPLRGRART